MRADGAFAGGGAYGRDDQCVRGAWDSGITWVRSKPGKQADFLIHEFADYRELAYFIAAPMRPRVFIGGREVTQRRSGELRRVVGRACVPCSGRSATAPIRRRS